MFDAFSQQFAATRQQRGVDGVMEYEAQHAKALIGNWLKKWVAPGAAGLSFAFGGAVISNFFGGGSRKLTGIVAVACGVAACLAGNFIPGTSSVKLPTSSVGRNPLPAVLELPTEADLSPAEAGAATEGAGGGDADDFWADEDADVADPSAVLGTPPGLSTPPPLPATASAAPASLPRTEDFDAPAYEGLYGRKIPAHVLAALNPA